MIWKETGVLKGSHLCYFNPSNLFKDYYVYMVSCGYFLCNMAYDIRRAGSRHPLFFYIISGELAFEYENVQFKAGAGEVVLLNGLRPHRYYCPNSCEFLFFHFDGSNIPALVDGLINSNGSACFHPKRADDIYANIYEPIMKLCYQERSSDADLSSLVYSTLCMIPDTGSDSALFIPSRVKLSPDMISYKVIEYIDTHIQDNFTAEELADHVNLSRHYFSRVFKKETGYTPLEYVAIAKVNYAKLMLRTTALSIAEIAEYLGYSSSASFINAFRMRRGISPNKYRHEYMKKASVSTPKTEN